MGATIAFSIFLLGLFTILELLKANQKFSFLKYFMLVILFWITISSFLDYLDLTGHLIPYYFYEISRFFGTGLFINLFYLLVFNKIPRIVLILEAIFVFFFAIKGRLIMIHTSPPRSRNLLNRLKCLEYKVSN